MNNLFVKSGAMVRTWAVVTAISFILSAFPASIFIAQAESTGITSDPVSRTLEVNEKGNFKISTIFDVASGTTPGTYISVTDNSATDSVYGGSLDGTCSVSVDGDSQFSIDQNKAFCYSNSVAGNYVVTVQLLDAAGGNPIGSPINVDVEVTAAAPVTPVVTCSLATAFKEFSGTSTNPIFDWNLTATGDTDAITEVKVYRQGNLYSTGGNFAFISAPTAGFIISGGYSHPYNVGLKMFAGEEMIAECDIDLAEVVIPGDGGPTDTVYGCMDDSATNYNPAATEVGDAVCTYPDDEEDGPVLCVGGEDGFEDDCVYPDRQLEITACKYNSDETPIEGWGMTITNNKGNEADVTFDDLLTEEDGCVSVSVYPEVGPFYVVEEIREGWTQEGVFASFGQVLKGEGDDYCKFFDREILLDKKVSVFDSVIIEPDYRCDFYNEKEPVDEIINTCLVPSTLGDESEFVINDSGEKTVAQMLADHGYVAVDTTNDQVNYQVWNLTDPSADTITFNLKVLGKRAGNTQILGYYKAGDGSTFASVLTQVSDTDGEVVVPVTIPAAFATSFGFGIKSADKTWFSEKSLNSDSKDHLAVYNPVANTYLLAFEDFNNLGDGDYNDLVIEIADVKCELPPPPVDMCLNIDGVQDSVPKDMYQNQAGDCVPLEEGEIINFCLIPNTLGDDTEFAMGNSGEKSVAQMLADHGYAAIDTTNDQVNYQVWDLVDPTADSITFNVKVLGKRAGNTQILGYYKAGDGLTFTSILAQLTDTDGEASIPVTIPAAFANSFGFGIKSADMTWYSEKSLNIDAKDHVAVYNPVANTYLLAFEDINNLGDNDYNDLVIEIADINCVEDEEDISSIDVSSTNGGGGGGGGGVRSLRSATPSVAGDSISASAPEAAPYVLGDQVSVVPAGAPGAGEGGTATDSLAKIFAAITTSRRKTKLG